MSVLVEIQTTSGYNLFLIIILGRVVQLRIKKLTGNMKITLKIPYFSIHGMAVNNTAYDFQCQKMTPNYSSSSIQLRN